jgi:hypothetical protein
MLKSNVEINDQKLLDETVGEHIGYDLGVKMVKDHYEKYGDGNAQFVGKNILEKLLGQPECIGINIYRAINENNEKTYVLVGIDKSNSPILENSSISKSGIIETQEGIVADRNKVVQGWFEI